MGLGLFVDLLTQSPLAYLVAIALTLFGYVLHNIAQAMLADRFGDATPRLSGFLKTDPVLHIGTFQLLFMAIFGIGFPNSIPVHSGRFRGRGGQEVLVWLSGPLALVLWSFVLLVISALLQRGVNVPGLYEGFAIASSLSLRSAVIFCIPIPPLDGARALLAVADANTRRFLAQLDSYGPIGFFLAFMLLSRLGVLNALTQPILNLFTALLRLLGLG